MSWFSQFYHNRSLFSFSMLVIYFALEYFLPEFYKYKIHIMTSWFLNAYLKSKECNDNSDVLQRYIIFSSLTMIDKSSFLCWVEMLSIIGIDWRFSDIFFWFNSISIVIISSASLLYKLLTLALLSSSYMFDFLCIHSWLHMVDINRQV